MIAFLYYPLYLAVFWYQDVVGGVIEFFVAFNKYLSSLLSVPLLIKTYFKPLKNEYRDGLVLFSVIAGMIVKSVLLSVTISIILIVLAIEFFVCVAMILLPFALPLAILKAKNIL